MTDKQLELIKEKTGTSKEDFLNALHLVYMLSDIQESYLNSVERAMINAGFYGFEDKQLIKDAIVRNRKVIKLVDRVTSYDFACQFGDKCDELKELIDNWVKKD